MAFRRKENKHDSWERIVRQNKDLLHDLPSEAIRSEESFRGYMTDGHYRGRRFDRPVSELSSKALEDLWTFINHKTEFDMDVLYFVDFRSALERTNESDSRRTG